MAADPKELQVPGEPVPEVTSRRGRKFVRLFLMTAGGLAAPCLALAAFFVSNSGDRDTPAKSAAVQGGRVTAPTTPATAKVTPPAPVTTTTTASPSPPVGPPPRDPFQPLVVQAPAGESPAR
jgi:type IV secretory pathway VirB10-like protein